MKNVDEKQVKVIDEEDNNGPFIIASFYTVKEAEDFIEEQNTIDPDKVHRGGFGIDAPEELVNPSK